MVKFTRHLCFIGFVATSAICCITGWNWQSKNRTALSDGESVYNITTNANIYHCITGDTIGIRPIVQRVPCSKLSYDKEPENEETRKAAFKYIFNNRIWGGKKGTTSAAANLKASGIILSWSNVIFVILAKRTKNQKVM